MKLLLQRGKFGVESGTFAFNFNRAADDFGEIFFVDGVKLSKNTDLAEQSFYAAVILRRRAFDFDGDSFALNLHDGHGNGVNFVAGQATVFALGD